MGGGVKPPTVQPLPLPDCPCLCPTTAASARQPLPVLDCLTSASFPPLHLRLTSPLLPISLLLPTLLLSCLLSCRCLPHIRLPATAVLGKVNAGLNGVQQSISGMWHSLKDKGNLPAKIYKWVRRRWPGACATRGRSWACMLCFRVARVPL